MGMSERFACKVVGLARSTYRRLPAAHTPADPDAGARAWLRSYAGKNPCHRFRRAWAVLRFSEGYRVNLKRVHRLWREEGLQVRAHHPRKRAGTSSAPSVDANAPKVVWAMDFQFDSTVDGPAVKIASMIDEHTRESLLHLVERSITGERLVAELERVFTTRSDAEGAASRQRTGNDFHSAAIVLHRPDGYLLNPAGHALEQRIRRVVQPAPARGVPELQPLDQPARSPGGDRRLQTRAQPPAPAFPAGLPHTGRVRCGLHPHPPPGELRDQLNTDHTTPTLNPGGRVIGDWSTPLQIMGRSGLSE